MSFSFEFTAYQPDAAALVAKETAPDCVKAFIAQALTAFKDTDLVFIKAMGHLYDGPQSYQRSSADIIVQHVLLRVPAVVAGLEAAVESAVESAVGVAAS